MLARSMSIFAVAAVGLAGSKAMVAANLRKRPSTATPICFEVKATLLFCGTSGPYSTACAESAESVSSVAAMTLRFMRFSCSGLVC